jgi:hypothetical protein
MFSFAKKDAVNKAVDLNAVSQQMPEGCEALSDCEFAEITGAAISAVAVHL